MTLIQLLFFCGLIGLGSSWSQPTDVNTCYVTETTPPKGTHGNPASSCKDIAQNSPSGEYWIQTSSSNCPIQLYCDMTSRNCSCNNKGGWTRVDNIDTTDPSQQCPDGFRLVTRTTAPLRTCGRPDNIMGCVSNQFPVHGIEYSHVCGRVIGYQLNRPDGFLVYEHNTERTIDDYYAAGISLTHGSPPRTHIWTFVAAIDENRNRDCPCTIPDLPYTGVVPPFIDQDYFCETGSRPILSQGFFPDDPLWNGQGCGGTSTCCSFNNPPWFCKELPQPTTDDIELRQCADGPISLIGEDDTPLEIVELYIK